MKKSSTILLVLIIEIVFLINLVVGDVRISEVMAETPSGTYGDSDCEWVEISSDSSQNLSNWILNTGAKNITFNFYIEDFLIITGNETCFKNNWIGVNESKIIGFSDIGLNDGGDDLFLYDNSSILINSMSYSSTNSDKSWQYCSSGWLENPSTSGASNNCSTPTTTQDPEIYLEVEWDEEDIVNGEEFEIKVKAFNLGYEDYNLKIWIKFDDNDTVISDRYDEGEEEWSSGRNYVDDFFEGPDNETENIVLRIRDNYEDYYGDDVEICFKLEEDETDTEECDNIEIIEKEEEDNDEPIIRETTPPTASPAPVGIIKLGNSSAIAETEDLKEQSNLIYQSKNELIKKYAIYGFAVLCVGLCILLVYDKLN